VEYTPEEQLLLVANRLRELHRFEFLVRTATREGDMTGRLRQMSIANLDRNQFPDYALVAEVERRLMARDGVPVQALLAEITARLKRPEPAPKPGSGAATMKGYAHPLPTSPQPSSPEAHHTTEDEDDETLREKA
jgi:hypothetical protein